MAVVKKKVGTLTPEKKKTAAERREAPAVDVSLPETPSTPSAHLGDYSWLLFGAKKIGKTNLASQFPDALFLMTEPGGKALSIYQRSVNNWTEFTGYVKLLEKDRRFKTQVVDTADLLFKMCERYVCRKRGIDHPSDEDWGKGWSAVRDEFVHWIQRLVNNGKGTVFISHATEREIKRKSGGSYHSIQPTLAGQARDVLEGIVDIFAYFDYDEDRRVLTIRGDEFVAAGSRLRNNFRWKDKEVSVIEMGTSAEEGYANLVACFNNKYQPRVRPTDEAEVAAPKKTVVKKKVTA